MHAAGVDYVAKQGAALAVKNPHPEACLARGRLAALHLKHGGHECDAVLQHILLPHIAVEPVAPVVLHKARGGGLNRFAREEEELRGGRVVGKVERHLAHVVKRRVAQPWRVVNEVAHGTRQAPLLGPLADEAAQVLGLDLAHNVALHVYVARLLYVVVVQGVKAVKAEEVVEALRVDVVRHGPRLVVGAFRPELGGHGQRHEAGKVAPPVAQLLPVPEVLARAAAVVAVLHEVLRQPHGVNVYEAQCKLAPLAHPRAVEVGNVVEHLHILHHLLVLRFAQAVRFGVEPQGAVAH